MEGTLNHNNSLFGSCSIHIDLEFPGEDERSYRTGDSGSGLLAPLFVIIERIHHPSYFIPPVAEEHVLQVCPWQMFFYFERRMIPRSQSNYYYFCQVIYTDGWASKITFHPKTKESVVLAKDL